MPNASVMKRSAQNFINPKISGDGFSGLMGVTASVELIVV